MDLKIKSMFIEKWEQYFPGADLPVACFYTDDHGDADFAEAPKPNKHGLTCIFAQLAPVRVGKARAFNQDNLGCWGSKGIFGFIPSGADEHTIDFLVNVERYKKSGEHVKAMFENSPPQPAKGKFIVFKPWDQLTESDEPEVVFFLSPPDVVSGLHGLANYDAMTSDGVIAPFGSGCESIVGFAMKEVSREEPRAVLGLFDPSARPFVKPKLQSFSVPWPKFQKMIEYFDDCFLNTYIWESMHKRIQKNS